MLFMRKSLSSTKKFFHRTFGSLKCLFTGGSYEKLPKSPPCNLFSGNSTAATTAAATSVLQWDAASCTKRREKKSDGDDHHIISTATTTTRSANCPVEQKKNDQAYPRKVMMMSNNKKLGDYCSKNKYCLVEEKLKELEMLDVSNVDHVLDIEEVLHYYSRLTCPAYLEIIDKFFVDMFAELFASSTPAHRPNSNSNSRFRSQSSMIRS
ncbi:uncharacterized protein LOC133793757 [Humulus lupulus]|uniref:uncharacterized protein LOC133793757 n=1 Tax=Humulus lupulus TaxID=3486 RepID=UPI002B40B860|nr:uncharacterized protein LOC133793757 [Humulus lupulus]